MNHAIKIRQEIFKALSTGHKSFVIKKENELVKVGDIAIFFEFDYILDKYTGAQIVTVINSVLSDFNGLEKGFTAFEFTILKRISNSHIN